MDYIHNKVIFWESRLEYVFSPLAGCTSDLMGGGVIWTKPRGPVSQYVRHDKGPPCPKAISTEQRPSFAAFVVNGDVAM